MWSKIVGLHRAIDAEQCKVLEDPDSLVDVPPGYRRAMAARLARMSPLERSRLLTFSRKYSGRLLWTRLGQIALAATLCALAASLLFPQIGLLKLVVLANLGGMALMVMGVAIYFSHDSVFGKPIHLVMFVAMCATLGVVAGTATGGWEKGFTFQQSLEKKWMLIAATSCATALLLAIPVSVVSAIRSRQNRAYNASLERDAQQQRAARELSESRLRLLHAQIEPHFLFNTLGAVQQLAEKDAPDAARLTANLIAFLRASLAEMRSETVSLAADFAMVDAYLQVMQARLGARLAYKLDLPESLAQVTIPSMMLLTLVENAIKHGIEPALRGGHINVTAAADAAQLRLTVSDTGPGLGSAPGSGHGLDNVRARLRLLHGDAAWLSVVDGDEHGVVAALVLPLEKGNA